MIVFEEYASAAEKRKAQKGAKRSMPTGLARGYLFLFRENGYNGQGMMDCVGTVYDSAPGADVNETGLASSTCSIEYLRTNCRRVGGKHLTGGWLAAWKRWK